MDWTTGQERFCEEFAHKGAVWLAGEMEREFGVKRTPGCIRAHCSRMGLSLKRYEICPECGANYTKLKATGLCPVCAAKEARDRSERRYFQALDNQALAAVQAKRYKTEDAMYRKRISRLKKNSESM